MIKNLFKAEWHKTQLITKNSVDERQENKPKTSFQSKHQKLRLVPSLLATYTMLGAEGFEGIVIQSPLELGGTRHMDQERAPFSQTPDTCSCFTAVTTYTVLSMNDCLLQTTEFTVAHMDTRCPEKAALVHPALRPRRSGLRRSACLGVLRGCILRTVAACTGWIGWVGQVLRAPCGRYPFLSTGTTLSCIGWAFRGRLPPLSSFFKFTNFRRRGGLHHLPLNHLWMLLLY